MTMTQNEAYVYATHRGPADPTLLLGLPRSAFATWWDHASALREQALNIKEAYPDKMVLICVHALNNNGAGPARLGYEVAEVHDEQVGAFRFYETDDPSRAASDYECDRHCGPLCDASCGGVCY